MAKKSRQPKVSSEEQKGQQQKQQVQKDQKFSLYVFLEVDPKATVDEIKKQYRKLVLKYHPDKNKQVSQQQARQQFQKLKKAYDILSDPQKRKLYDQTGTIEGEGQLNQKDFQSAYEYFRKIYKKVTKEDLIEFQKSYRMSAMEEEDLLDYYERHEGNMVQLIESIPCSLNEDVKRFIQFFENQIKQKKLTKYPAFDKTKKKVRHLPDQSKQFAELQQASMNQLVLAIRGKMQNQKDFISALQQKYGGAKKTKASKKEKTKSPKK